MKRILHISKYYYPFKGGTEQVARDCVNALKDDYEQRVICFSETRKKSFDKVDGIDVVRVGCFAKVSSQSLSISYGQLLRQTINEFNPDIIIFHYPNPFAAYYLLRFVPANCKLVVYWHLDIIRQKLLRILFVGQNKRLIRRADKLIATSPPYIDGSKYLSSAREKCVVIPNCINEKRLEITPQIQKRADEIRIENEGKTICLAVGRHTKYKGFDYLIKAAHLLDDSFRVFLIGKGEETKKLKRLAGTDSKIHFLGEVDDDELKAYMLAMDIFCFPSVTRNEAFGISLAEAMYFGKPAVTFTIDDSGVNYVSKNKITGIEVGNRDYCAFADAIILISKDEGSRLIMGEKARLRARSLFIYAEYRGRIKWLFSNYLEKRQYQNGEISQ